MFSVEAAEQQNLKPVRHSESELCGRVSEDMFMCSSYVWSSVSDGLCRVFCCSCSGPDRFRSSSPSFSLVLRLSLLVSFLQRWRWSSGLRRRLVTWRRRIEPLLGRRQVGNKRVCVCVCVPNKNPQKNFKNFKPHLKLASVAFARGLCVGARLWQSGSGSGSGGTSEGESSRVS